MGVFMRGIVDLGRRQRINGRAPHAAKEDGK